MKVDVTAEDIQQGAAGNCLHCPIALAMTRLNLRDVRVWDKVAAFTDPVGIRVRCPLPQEAQDFIENYDRARDVAPFSFELTP